MSKVWDLETESAVQKLVLLAMADNANDAGVCWPSLPTLARKSGLSESTVRSHLRDLESKGWIDTQTKAGTSSTYTIKLPDTPPESGPPPAPGAPPADTGVPHREPVPTPPPAGAHPTGSRPLTVREPSLNHHMKRTGDACASKMSKPTLDQVKLLGAKIGLPEEECCHFYDHYESNGWKVGRNPMRSAASAIANWKRNQQAYGPKSTQQPRINQRNIGCAKPTTDIGAAAAKRSVLAQMAKSQNGSLFPTDPA